MSTTEIDRDEAPLLVAVDDGYAQTKLYGRTPGGGIARAMIRSSARPGRYALMRLDGEGGIGSYQTEEGEDYTVSEDIEGENTQFDGFHTSGMNRVLVHHALRSAGYGGRSVDLWAGLPVADFFSGGRKNARKIEAKQQNLARGVRNASGPDPVARIARVRVGCQALSAFVDHFLDDDLRERDVAVEKVAVVDIGGRTTDVALVLDGASFDPRHSGTENVGVLDVYRALSDLVRARFGTRDEYPLSLLDRAVRTGRIKLWGKQHEVADLVEEAVREQQTKVAREVERRLGSASDVDTVLFVGGGSALFTGIAELFPNGVIPPDPEFANARGLYKYALKFQD